MGKRLFIILVLAFTATATASMEPVQFELANMMSFQRFVDELPIPPRLRIPHGQTDVTITLNQFQTKLHRDLGVANVWGYDNASPGPVIEVDKNQLVRIHWKNELPTTHILKAAMGVEMKGMANLPDVRNVTHLHGAADVESDPMDKLHNNDGWPDAWNVPGEEQIAEYPNPQSARILWYHDHAVGTTGRNVAAGLVGMYLIHDKFERRLNIPKGKYDVPLIIMARGVNADGSLYYSKTISVEYYGNSVSVNGKLWPFMNVEPRKYRFRFLNASNARAFAMKLVDYTNQKLAGPAFYQIGSDSGFLEKPAVLNDPNDPASPELILASAERADVIIDFSQFAGRSLLLTNNMRSDDPDSEIPISQIMLFKVGTTVTEPDHTVIPAQLRPIKRLDPAKAAQTRDIVISQTAMPDGTPMLVLNGKMWEDPIEERPVLGTTEVWNVINTTVGTHPFHVHLVQFQVLDRRPFDWQTYLNTGKLVYTGPAVAPDVNEMGWKDVVRAPTHMVTRIIIPFGPYPGYYVYHCHILEHEDMDMMRPFQVVMP